MRKFVLSVFIALSSSAIGFAQNDSKVADWNMEMHMSQLCRYLKLSANQYDEVANALDYFNALVSGEKISDSVLLFNF